MKYYSEADILEALAKLEQESTIDAGQSFTIKREIQKHKPVETGDRFEDMLP